MKQLLLELFILSSLTVFGQKPIEATTELTIKGVVKQGKIITLAEFSQYGEEPIDDVVITNHSGERKGVAKALKGVPLRKVLAAIQFDADNSKLLSEFYLTFIASDGYKVVYSWNEIFNSNTGLQTFIVTEKEGKALAEMPERILVVTKSDEKTGRRYIKGLEQIVVSRVQ